jgi:hypothetical protein
MTLGSADLSSPKVKTAKLEASVADEAVVASPKRQRLLPKDYKLSDIRRAIPEHLFKRNTLHSLGYMTVDLCMVAIVGYLGLWIPSAPFALQFLLWPLYTFVQGTGKYSLLVLDRKDACIQSSHRNAQ